VASRCAVEPQRQSALSSWDAEHVAQPDSLRRRFAPRSSQVSSALDGPKVSFRSSPFFILGAGFGADAGGLVGPIEAQSIYIGKYRFSCAYPLVRDLPRVCFPDATPPVSASDVESRLDEALRAGNEAPLDFLCEELAKADYYLGRDLSVGLSTRTHTQSSLLTFRRAHLPRTTTMRSSSLRCFGPVGGLRTRVLE